MGPYIRWCEKSGKKISRKKGVEIIEAEPCKAHIHKLVSISLKESISSFVGYLKGNSNLMKDDIYCPNLNKDRILI